MESGSVPVETRINAIADYKVKKLSKKAIARKYGVSDSTVRIQQDEEKQGRSLKTFLNVIYNNERPEQSLGGLSSVQFREHNPKGTYLMVIKD